MGLIKITTRHLNQITWASTSECTFLLENTVDNWNIHVNANLSFLDDFLSVMQPEEIAAADRFFHTADKNRSIITRGAVRLLLGKYLNQSPTAIRFGVGVNKKPYLIDPENASIHFNISHSADRIWLAVADKEVGTDIEHINPLFNYQDIITDYFSKGEVEYIKQLTPLERFFTLWTRKEAMIKATGKGLVDNIDSLPGLDGTHIIPADLIGSNCDWLIDSFKTDTNYVASVAYNPVTAALRYFDYNFNKMVNIT